MRVTQRVGHHEIDSSTEHALKIFFESEIGVERIRCARHKIDEDVDVTVLGIETVAGCRAKQSKAPHAMRAARESDRFTVQNQGGTHDVILPAEPQRLWCRSVCGVRMRVRCEAGRGCEGRR